MATSRNRILHLSFCVTLGLWIYIASFKCNILEALKYSETVRNLPMLMKLRIGSIGLMLMSIIPILLARATFPRNSGFFKALFNWLCLAQGAAQSLEWAIANFAWAFQPSLAEHNLLTYLGLSVAAFGILVIVLLLAYSSVGIPLIGMQLCFPRFSERIENKLRRILKESRDKTGQASYLSLVKEEMRNSDSFTENLLLQLVCLPYLAYDFFYFRARN